MDPTIGLVYSWMLNLATNSKILISLWVPIGLQTTPVSDKRIKIEGEGMTQASLVAALYANLNIKYLQAWSLCTLVQYPRRACSKVGNYTKPIEERSDRVKMTKFQPFESWRGQNTAIFCIDNVKSHKQEPFHSGRFFIVVDALLN